MIKKIYEINWAKIRIRRRVMLEYDMEIKYCFSE